MLKGTYKPIPNYNYRVLVTKVRDGDTVEGILDLGFKLTCEDVVLRFAVADAYETKGKKDKDKRDLAIKGKQHVIDKVLGEYILIKTYKRKDGSDKADSFARYISVIYYWDYEKGQEVNLNQELLDMGLAVIWKG